MDKNEIIRRAGEIDTLETLIQLINDLKFEEIGDGFKPFSMAQLKYFTNPNFTYNRYKISKIAKKNGGVRFIYSPCMTLKSLQHYINILLTALHSPNENSFGFIPGKNIIGNASIHTNKNYVYNIDLSDFFTSITQTRIWKRLQLSPFNFNRDVAKYISGIACIKLFASHKTGLSEPSIRLPQGSPSSPTIANAICDSLDVQLQKLATRYNINYSRYADDITFSSNHNVFQQNSTFNIKLRDIINRQGFKINESKTRLQKRDERQVVTGIVVNKKVNIKREKIRSIRQILYIWSKYGYMDANLRFEKYFNKHLKIDEEKTPKLIDYLKGNFAFIRMVKGNNTPQYLKMKQKFINLSNDSIIRGQYRRYLKFIDTWKLDIFEISHGEIKFSKSHKTSAYYFKDDKPVLMSVSKSINDYDKSKLSVSYCERCNGSHFLLIHETKNIW